MESLTWFNRLVFIVLLWDNLAYVTSVRMPLGMTEQGPPPAKGMVVTGDMAMTEELHKNLTSPVESRKIIIQAGAKWPELNGAPTVYYYFRGTGSSACVSSGANICNKYGAEIRNGMDHWEEHTCLKFRPALVSGKASLEIINGNGCWSYIGVIDSTQPQQLSIGDGCQSLGIVVHELGHAVGLLHEQSRSDRDNHVRVNLDNVDVGRRHNFEKYTTSNYGTYSIPYDYSSVMHYDALAFSSNGDLTIATTEILHQGIIGRGEILSHRDKHIVNKHYNCLGKWLTQCGLTSDPCINEGYLGKNCQCICPPGTMGDQCQTKTADYYESYLSKCSRVISSETVLTSPNYPSNIAEDTWCIYHIKAPAGFAVQLTVLDFSMERYSSSGGKRCATAFLEIRDEVIYEGRVFCGNDIRAYESFVSRSRDMILYLDVPLGSRSKGFKANVTFIENIEEETTKTTTIETTTTEIKTTTTKGEAKLLSPNYKWVLAILALTQFIGMHIE